MDLAIDVAANAVGVWNSGRCKLWLLVDETAPVVDAPSLPRERVLAQPAAGQVLRLRSPIAGAIRFWRHRTPRPDSLALHLALVPRADERVVLRAPEIAEAPHRPVLSRLGDGAQRALDQIASVPIGGLDLAVLAWQDDGPSSAEGIALAMEHGLAALLLAAYRRRLLPYL